MNNMCVRVCLQAFYYPPDAGLPMGGPGSSRFLRLEVHYHNPLHISGTYRNTHTLEPEHILTHIFFFHTCKQQDSPYPPTPISAGLIFNRAIHLKFSTHTFWSCLYEPQQTLPSLSLSDLTVCRHLILSFFFFFVLALFFVIAICASSHLFFQTSLQFTGDKGKRFAST